MRSEDIRRRFLEYFSKKGHAIVPSAPIVVKDDPTLMFTNAGMNQFKDYFLGNTKAFSPRVADTQKCLRVSGKHNDLEEVGRDSYHHTMFEMLGNWSFGDYFKKEAIQFAWELLTEEFGINPENLYVTVFGGDKIDNTGADEEAASYWDTFIPKERILYFGKKDNFWEMGDTGPCGPCSEIHIDLRSEKEKEETPGKDLVNMDHPLVIEIWNLVFIQYNRKADGSLEELPDKHVDTGMGFERLSMVLQGKTSNYETDIFTPFITAIERKSGIQYTNDYSGDSMSDIAMRVISDHLRAVSFTIADGEMPANTGAGYVIRRVLRRAVRYYYSFLNIEEPFMHSLVEILAEQMQHVFPELHAQADFITRVIFEEEKSFLRTLAEGLRRLEQLKIDDGTLSGRDAFELYDTYGFPFDLTRLVAEEKGWNVNEKEFEEALREQKQRSRADAEKKAGDWVILNDNGETEFVGYDKLEVSGVIPLRYRIIEEKGQAFIQLILSRTPFYPEGGGQVGDTGILKVGQEEIKVQDTKKENELIVHYIDRLPENWNKNITAKVDDQKRQLTENNHSATHLLHAALRQVLGDHVQQKGSLVREDLLRFDFSHFDKLTEDEINRVEDIVNERIRQNIRCQENRRIGIEEAKEAGAMMLFGEKYGEEVRMITFDSNYSVELCGGCHVDSTGRIGQFRIVSETGIAAGVRRITAVSARAADEYIREKLNELQEIKALFKHPENTKQWVEDLQIENRALKKEIDQLQAAKAGNVGEDLKKKIEKVNGINILAEQVPIADSKAAKTLLFNLEKDVKNAALLIGIETNGKAQLMLMISKELADQGELDANVIIKELSSYIKGGGGGQPFFATAGGAEPGGIQSALAAFKERMK